MIATVTAAAVPVPIDIVAWQQPVDGILKIGFGTAAGLDQGHAGGCMRHKDVTQAVAAVPTELKDLLADIGDKTVSGTQLHDIGIHASIIATGVDGRPPPIPHHAETVGKLHCRIDSDMQLAHSFCSVRSAVSRRTFPRERRPSKTKLTAIKPDVPRSVVAASAMPGFFRRFLNARRQTPR